VELVAIDGVLENLILFVELGLVVILDKVGDGLASVLNLLVPVPKRSESDRVDGLVDGVGAVVPVQQPSDTLMSCGVALESITRQLVVAVRSK